MSFIFKLQRNVNLLEEESMEMEVKIRQILLAVIIGWDEEICILLYPLPTFRFLPLASSHSTLVKL